MLEIYACHGDGDGGDGGGGGGGGGDDDDGKVQAWEPGENGQNGDADGDVGGWEVEAKEQEMEMGMVSHRFHGGSAVV